MSSVVSGDRFAGLRQVQYPSLVNKSVIVPVRVIRVSPKTVIEADGQQVNLIPEVHVRDRGGITMRLVAIQGDRHIDQILDAAFNSTEVELTAQVVVQDGRYALAHIESSPIRSALQLVGATQLEIEAAAAKRSGGPLKLDEVRAEMVAILNVGGVESFTALRKGLDGVVLQSVSGGSVNGTPGNVSQVNIGPPGVSKGVLQRAAEIVSAVYQRVSTTRVTPAGLVGMTRYEDGHLTTQPGQLALASLGVAMAQDLQNIDTHTHRHFYGILSDMLEWGRLVRSTDRGIDIPVETALLADINPKSTTQPRHRDTPVYYLEDLGLPINFLSRLDLVIVFPRDIERQIATMRHIVDSVTCIGPAVDLASDPRSRELQVYLAALRDAHPVIEVGGVNAEVHGRLNRLIEANAAKLKALTLFADFAIRGAKSVLKLVAASARLNDRDVAVPEDVAIAFDLFEEKMAFLSQLEPGFRTVRNLKDDLRTHRLERLREHFAGQQVHISVPCGMFPDIARRTIQRDLRELGAVPTTKGYWQLEPEEPPVATVPTSAVTEAK